MTIKRFRLWRVLTIERSPKIAPAASVVTRIATIRDRVICGKVSSRPKGSKTAISLYCARISCVFHNSFVPKSRPDGPKKGPVLIRMAMAAYGAKPKFLIDPLSLHHHVQPQIQHPRRMCQRPDRNQIDAGFGDRANSLQRHAAGGLRDHASANHRDRLAQFP